MGKMYLIFCSVILLVLIAFLSWECMTFQHCKVTNLSKKINAPKKKGDDRFMEFGYQFGPHLGLDGQMRMGPGVGYNIFGF